MKKITRFLMPMFFVLIIGKAKAQFTQVWDAQYQHTTSPGFSNEGRRIAEDAAGNIFVLSDVTSDIDPSGFHGTGTFHYISISKYSTNGNLLNTVNMNIQKHIYSGFNNLSAFGFEIDASGNVYAGYSSWFSSVNNFDISLTKFDNNLVRLWSNTYATPGDDIGVEMKLHTSGKLYAIVKSVNGTAAYSLIESVPSNNPAVLVYTFPFGSAVINCLALDGAQKAFVGGYSVKGGYKNAYVAAINIPSATLAWGSVYTPPSIAGDDVVNKITVGIDGNVYSVGTSYQGVTLGNQVLGLKNLPGNSHFSYIALLGDAGSNEAGLLINASENGWVYIGAVAGINASVYRFPSSGSYMTAAKVLFAPVPSAQFNSVNSLTLNSMKISAAKNIYLTGGIAATGNLGDFNCSYLCKGSVVFGNALVRVGGITVKGDFDQNYEGLDLSLDYGKADVYMLCNFWDNAHNSEKVILYDMGVTGTLREAGTDISGNNSELNLSISPNPASSKLTIQADEEIFNIEIMDMTGKQLSFFTGGSRLTTIDVSSLSAGLYLCKVRTANSENIRRLVKD